MYKVYHGMLLVSPSLANHPAAEGKIMKKSATLILAMILGGCGGGTRQHLNGINHLGETTAPRAPSGGDGGGGAGGDHHSDPWQNPVDHPSNPDHKPIQRSVGSGSERDHALGEPGEGPSMPMPMPMPVPMPKPMPKPEQKADQKFSPRREEPALVGNLDLVRLSTGSDFDPSSVLRQEVRSASQDFVAYFDEKNSELLAIEKLDERRGDAKEFRRRYVDSGQKRWTPWRPVDLQGERAVDSRVSAPDGLREEVMKEIRENARLFL